MQWKNKVTQILKVQYPLIQAPMFGVSTPEMVAGANAAGCLGSLPLADLSAEKSIEVIRATKQLTIKPFAVNIFAHTIPVIDNHLRQQYRMAKEFISEIAKAHNLAVNLPDIDDLPVHSYHEQIDAVISENCKLLSFTFGNLDQASIEKLKNNGTVLIGTCTSVEEAMALEKSGIDIICVQGWEAGGHRGSFQPENIPQVGGLSLLAQVADTVNVPIVYAGGLYNTKTLLASKTLGACGFQIGSLLLGSKESALNDFEKDRLRNVQENEIVLTNSFSGRFARGIKNTFSQAMEESGLVLPFPYQNKLTAVLRKVAKTQQNTEFLNLWTGQSIQEYSDQSTADIFNKLIAEVEML